MTLEEIKDPKLRQRLIEAMAETDRLVRDIRKECPKIGKRIRQSSRPLMNKLEQEYYDQYLCQRQALAIMVQSVRFKLGNGIWYKPDFFTMHQMCVSNTAIEVKGPRAFRGGFENLKVAASLYPWIKWVLVWKEGGEWREQAVLP